MNLRALHLLAWRLVGLLFVYSVLRFAFLAYHWPLYRQVPSAELVMSLLSGIRFDIAALCWINAFFLFWAFRPQWTGRAERSVFLAVNGLFLLIAVVDLEFFSFNGKRMSRDIFAALNRDLVNQIPQLAVSYWYLVIAALLVTAGLALADVRNAARVRDRFVRRRLATALLALLPVLFFTGIRGGVQRKSIDVQAAFVQGSPELGHLVLNTPYHLLRTFRTPLLRKRSWMPDAELVRHLAQLRHDPAYPGHPDHNVVFFMVESLSLEYLKQGYTPFLSDLASRGILFDRHFANGRRSVESLPALFDAIPSLMDTPFSKSSYQGMRLEGVASRLKADGYATAFFHGGNRATMGFESYCLSHGFDIYRGREDYPNGNRDYDGTWGIYDGPYLKYALEQIDRLPAPFFACVFTLSSHQPYSIPGEWKGKFPAGTLAIHESIGYVDHMLRLFIQDASSRPWYSNTLFVVTADHAQKQETREFNNSLGQFRVPLVLFHPAVRLDPSLGRKVTQHADVPMTILDFLDVDPTGLNLVGESAFAPGPGHAVQHLLPGWQYVTGSRVLIWDEHTDGQEYDWEAETGILRPAGTPVLRRDLQVFLQYFFNSLVQNRWMSTYR